MEAKVSRLAALIEAKIARHVPAPKPELKVVGGTDSMEASAMRAWDAHRGAEEHLCAPALDSSTRAVQTRAILRIAQTYGWQSGIAHFLDTKGVAYMTELSDPQLEDLHLRMLGYVDAAQTGCSLEDCFPAT